MEEFLLYTKTLKEIITRHYEKEMVYYDCGEWYSREHCRKITFQELCDWVLEITTLNEECDEE
jgi:hypothetical protein